MMYHFYMTDKYDIQYYAMAGSIPYAMLYSVCISISYGYMTISYDYLLCLLTIWYAFFKMAYQMVGNHTQYSPQLSINFSMHFKYKFYF